MAPEKPRPAGAKTQQGKGYTLELLVSDDLLSAKVRLTKTQRTSACSAADVVAFVHSAGLALGKSDEERLQAAADKLVASATTATEVVAHGVPVKPWAAVEWFVPLGEHHHAQDGDRGKVDLHEVTRFANAKAGQRLCLLPAPPAAGRDVYGHALAAPPAPVRLGVNVGTDPGDPRCAVAQHDGCARLVEGVLSVEEQLDIKGDLDFKVGNIDFWGAVVIHGSVPDDFHVKATKSVIVEGSVGMAVIEAGADLTIKGGVNGARKARLVCGGALRARFLHGAHVEAGGDVAVEVECLDSVVHAGGNVKVARGGIIGGEVRAKGHVEAPQLGSELCVPTAVTAGSAGAGSSPSKAQLADLEEADEIVAKTTAELGRLVAGAGHKLSPAQQERQASLQAHLATAHEKLHRARRELAEFSRAHGATGGVIKAAKTVFPRVAIGIGGVYHLDLKSELRGPVTFSADLEKGAVKVEARKPNEEAALQHEGEEDPAERWRWGPAVLFGGLLLAVLLSWSPGSRLLLQAGPLKVARCEVVDNFAGGARARVEGVKGQAVELSWEDFARPQDCVPEGTLVEKQRGSFDYLYNGVPFPWPKGVYRFFGPLAAACAVLGYFLAALGKRLALSRAAAAHKPKQ